MTVIRVENTTIIINGLRAIAAAVYNHHPDIGTFSKAMGIMNNFTNDIFGKLAQERDFILFGFWLLKI